jgi:hypothetical protein
MKPISLLLLSCLLLVGCQENGGTRGQEAREGMRDAVNAPADYVTANVRAQQQAQTTTALNSVNGAIRMFQVSEGRNPSNLNELVQQNYLPALPELPRGAVYRYDPQTGQASVDTQ